MNEVVTIQEIIEGVVEATVEGVEAIDDAGIPVELDEFEVEASYAAETFMEKESEKSVQLKFKPIKAKIGHTKTSRNKATYGLKVRFLFVGKAVEAAEGG